jgi:hypothetical protein
LFDDGFKQRNGEKSGVRDNLRGNAPLAECVYKLAILDFGFAIGNFSDKEVL